jgi:hypothetical protein
MFLYFQETIYIFSRENNDSKNITSTGYIYLITDCNVIRSMKSSYSFELHLKLPLFYTVNLHAGAVNRIFNSNVGIV